MEGTRDKNIFPKVISGEVTDEKRPPHQCFSMEYVFFFE
jgi:hypothetical protein